MFLLTLANRRRIVDYSHSHTNCETYLSNAVGARFWRCIYAQCSWEKPRAGRSRTWRKTHRSWWSADTGSKSPAEPLPQCSQLIFLPSSLVQVTQRRRSSFLWRTILSEMHYDTWSWRSTMFNLTISFSVLTSRNRSPEVEMCGYSIPHPSEAKMNLRIQTYGMCIAIW